MADLILAVSERGALVCDHELGRVGLAPRQSLVRSQGGRLLVDDDPEHRPIAGCPNTNPLAGILPCRNTLPVQSGYSSLVRIDGRRLCLQPVTGMTDGVPPNFHYKVRESGQSLLRCAR
ncbi:MAG TPA: hypothetical protein VGO86_02475 [Candidatus Dormibacteraeota bacterium]